MGWKQCCLFVNGWRLTRFSLCDTWLNGSCYYPNLLSAGHRLTNKETALTTKNTRPRWAKAISFFLWMISMLWCSAAEIFSSIHFYFCIGTHTFVLKWGIPVWPFHHSKFKCSEKAEHLQTMQKLSTLSKATLTWLKTSDPLNLKVGTHRCLPVSECTPK